MRRNPVVVSLGILALVLTAVATVCTAVSTVKGCNHFLNRCTDWMKLPITAWNDYSNAEHNTTQKIRWAIRYFVFAMELLVILGILAVLFSELYVQEDEAKGIEGFLLPTIAVVAITIAGLETWYASGQALVIGGLCLAQGSWIAAAVLLWITVVLSIIQLIFVLWS